MDKEKSIKALTLFTKLAADGESSYDAGWAIPYLVGKWSISNPYIRKVVGEEGKIEIPVERLSSTGLHDGKFRFLTEEFVSSLSAVLSEFMPWENRWAYPYAKTVEDLVFTHTSRLFVEIPAQRQSTEHAPLKVLKNARKTLDYFFHQMEKQNKEDFDKAIDEMKAIGRFYVYRRKIELAKERFSELENFASQTIPCDTGKLVISALPEDIVSASWNTFGWDSCTNPYEEYALTLLAQVRGESTLIAYVVGNDIPDFEEEGVTFSNKRWRAFIYVDDEGNFSMARHYPNHVPFLENKVWDVIKEKLEDPREITKEVGKIDFPAVYVDDRTSSLVRPGSSFSLHKTLYCYESDAELDSDDYGVVARAYADGSACCDFCGDFFDEGDNRGERNEPVCCGYCYENGRLEEWLRDQVSEQKGKIQTLTKMLDAARESMVGYMETIANLKDKITILTGALKVTNEEERSFYYDLLPDPEKDFCASCGKYIRKDLSYTVEDNGNLKCIECWTDE